MSQGPQACGRRMARPIDFGGILHRQHQGDLVKTTIGRLDMARQDVLGGDVVIREEAIGGFEHGAIATGFGKGGGGMLGQDMSEFHQALCPSHITQLGIGKFVHRPVDVLGLAPHTRLLMTMGCSSSIPSARKPKISSPYLALFSLCGQIVSYLPKTDESFM